jgi:hypothetical protein
MMQVVIANRLRDGRVVFLTEKDQWALYLEDARVAHNDGDAETIRIAAQRSADDNEVVDPQLIEVVEEAGGLRPKKLREAIRALGPTVRQDLGKQAEH